MHIVCEQCNMKFKIKDGAIKSHGRVVRCGNCEYEWVAKPYDKNIIHPHKHMRKVLFFLIPILFVLIFAWFAYFLRNDEVFYFLELNDSPHLVVENINTHFYDDGNHSYAIAKTKIHNISDSEEVLDSVMVILNSIGSGRATTVIDDVHIKILPDRSVIIPIKVEDVNLDLTNTQAFVGGKNRLRLKAILGF